MKTILLVEDNLLDAELALNILNEECAAANVECLRDGEQAVNYLFRRGAFASAQPVEFPIVILLDLKLPKINGLEVLQAVKSDPLLKAIPIVMLTSSREERDVIESYRLGANAYVVKPVESGEYNDTFRQIGRFWANLNKTPSER